ncbi:hypothetical protein EST38_g6284 [Candolleomyces aberdarensis]|uniref:Uncharacterized protein n=1 Tax=Candolleomyces aberdarensis TaxID=2316362 RepID=A0A4Q2DI52_9AGAR|nr:hypothetical protein EST38_g6284 [Candolleomyces aberdarensis]
MLSSSKGISSAQYIVVNAKASSSKNQLPPSKYKSVDDVLSLGRPRSPPPLDYTDPAKSPSSSFVATKFSLAHQALNPTLGSRTHRDTDPMAPQAHINAPGNKGFALPFAPGRTTVAGRNGGPSPHEAVLATNEREATRENGTAIRDPVEAHARGIDSLGRRQPPDDSDNDFFARSESEEQRKNRRTDGEPKPQSNGDIIIPRIDLKEAASTLSRRQSSASSARTHSLRGSTSSSRRESYDSTASNSKRVRRSSSLASLRDLQRFAEVGRQQLLGQLAKRHGFDISVAFKAYERLQDLDATDTFLSELRRKAAKASVDLMQEMLPSDYEDNDDRDSDTAVSSHQAQRRRQSKAPRESLSVRPLPEDDPGHMSDYTPPRKSRAGRFARKQGRESGILHATPAWDSVMPHTQTPNVLLEQHSRPLRRYSRASDPDVASPPGPNRRSSFRVSLSPLRSSQHQVPPSTPPLLEQEEEPEGSVVSGSGTEAQEVAEELSKSVNEKEEDGAEAEAEAEEGEGGEMDVDASDEDVEEDGREEVPGDDADGDLDFSQLHPKNFFAALPPHQQEKQVELIKLATTVNRNNLEAMRAWEAEQDADTLETHQDFLLQTLFHRIMTGDPSPFTFDDYFN